MKLINFKKIGESLDKIIIKLKKDTLGYGEGLFWAFILNCSLIGIFFMVSICALFGPKFLKNYLDKSPHLEELKDNLDTASESL